MLGFPSICSGSFRKYRKLPENICPVGFTFQSSFYPLGQPGQLGLRATDGSTALQVAKWRLEEQKLPRAGYGSKKGHLKNPIGKRKNRPKPVVPKAFLFDP